VGCQSSVPAQQFADASPDSAKVDAGPKGTCPELSDRPVKVFVLAGQSNMVGAGTVSPTASHLERNGGMGTLAYLVDHAGGDARFTQLVDATGGWAERDDVWVVGLDRSGPLTVGFGADPNHIGPEYAFGRAMGDRYDELVVIIKVAWGGKSLQVDFRPPSSGGEVGPYYTAMIDRVRSVLDNLASEVPAYGGQGFELAGFGWHQGWNDRIDQAANDEYQTNCVNLINDLRRELGVEELPFVLATTGMSGWEETHPRALSLMEAQLAVPADERLEHGGVRAVETRDFWRPAEVSPADQGYHWNRNAETYLLIGEGMAAAMAELLGPACAGQATGG
jgi:alpha-galactosidase